MAFIGEPVEVLLGAAVTAVQRNAGAQLNGVTDAILRYGCSVAGAAAAGAGTAAASGAQAPSTPAGPGPDCPTARGRGPAHKWKPHEIEVRKASDTGTSCLQPVHSSQVSAVDAPGLAAAGHVLLAGVM